MWVAYLFTSLPHFVLCQPVCQPAEATPTSSADNAAPTKKLGQPLHEIPGVRIDRSSLTVGDGGVLVHYISDDVAFETATKAIIIIQGVLRNASDAYLGVQGGVQAAGVENVVLLAVRTLVNSLKRLNLLNTRSPFSSMRMIRVNSLGRMARQLPISSCGKVSMHPHMVENDI